MNLSDVATSFDAEALARRAAERAEVHAALEPIVDAINAAQDRLSHLSVIGGKEQIQLSRARIDLLRVEASVDAGDTP